MTTVVGVISDKESAETVVPRLVDAGIDRDTIGLMWRDKNVREPDEIKVISYHDDHEDASTEAGKGAVGGAVGGAATGAGAMLLASAGLALIPGIGAFLAAGTIAATVGAAAAGAVGGTVTGGLIGALIGATDDGATRSEEAHTRYRDAIERDGYLVTIDAVDPIGTDDVVRIMEEAGVDEVSVLSDAT